MIDLEILLASIYRVTFFIFSKAEMEERRIRRREEEERKRREEEERIKREREEDAERKHREQEEKDKYVLYIVNSRHTVTNSF